jgi:hypothetical protein
LHIRGFTDATQLTTFFVAATAAISIISANPVADPDDDITNTASVVDAAQAAPSTSPAVPELASPLWDEICKKCEDEKDSCMKVREPNCLSPLPFPS